MKNINEVLRKLAETRLPCPTFIMDELERLYYESDENGMANALLEADLLSTKKELAERDRTIASLNEESLANFRVAAERGKESTRLLKALEEAETLIAPTPMLNKKIWMAYTKIKEALGE